MTPVKLSSALDPAAATRVLFDEHARMVLALCRAVLREREEADDAVQETFLAAHRALLAGHEPRRPAGWLAAIARNECRARLRRRAVAPIPVADAERHTSAESTADVADARRELGWLTDQIRALPARQRETFVLHELRGLSHEEIAAEVGVSKGVVRGLLARARGRLREGRRAIPAPVLLDPAGIREQLARVLPGFEPAATTGTGAAGIAWGPIAAKLAVASAGLATLAPAAAPPGAPLHPAPATPPAAASRAPAELRAHPAAPPVVAARPHGFRAAFVAAPAARHDRGRHGERGGHEQASGTGSSQHGHSEPAQIVSSSGPGGHGRSEPPAPISAPEPTGGSGSGHGGAPSSSSGPSGSGESSSGDSGPDSSGPGPGSGVETAEPEASSSGHGGPEVEEKSEDD